MDSKTRSYGWKVIIILVIAFGVIQLVPYGHQRGNPPVGAEPHWDTAQTRALYQRACFDCHSNETHWPWYAHVAPVSWLLENDVTGGRRHVNFSQWNQPQRDAKDVAREVASGDMPPWYYLPMHPAARLSAAERQAMIASAAATLGPQAARKR